MFIANNTYNICMQCFHTTNGATNENNTFKEQVITVLDNHMTKFV
jgi:hypothetical protein